MNDSAIIECIQKNENKVVLKELYKVALPSISKFIKSNKGTQLDADEYFQEGVLGLILAIKTGRFNTNYSIRSYLFGIVRNKWFSELKRRGIQVSTESITEHEADDEPQYLNEKQISLVNEAIDSLGHPCKDLIRMISYSNKRHKEVKEIMGFASEAVVKTTYYRCKQKLKGIINKTPALRLVVKGE